MGEDSDKEDGPPDFEEGGDRNGEEGGAPEAKARGAGAGGKGVEQQAARKEGSLDRPGSKEGVKPPKEGERPTAAKDDGGKAAEPKTVLAKRDEDQQKDIMKLLVNHNKRQAMNAVEATAIFVGAQGCGKSSLMQRYVSPEKEEDPKATLALEYSFMRKATAKGGVGNKETCHLWEIGGGAALAGLLDVPLSESSVKNCLVAICVDLSKPEETFPTIVFWMERIRNRLFEVEKALKQKAQTAKLMEQLRDRAAKRFGEKHPDNVSKEGVPGKGNVRHTGVTVVIVANKFDVFTQREPEIKRVMGKTLRYLAHTNGAGLLYTSTKDKPALTHMRNLLNQFLFKGPPVKIKVTDHLKALMVPAGADVILQGEKPIGVPPVDKSALEKNPTPLDLWRQVFESYFTEKVPPLTMGVEAVPEIDPQGQFKEKEIDEARAQKEEELRLYRQARDRAAAELVKATAKPAARPAVARTSSSAAAKKSKPKE